MPYWLQCTSPQWILPSTSRGKIQIEWINWVPRHNHEDIGNHRQDPQLNWLVNWEWMDGYTSDIHDLLHRCEILVDTIEKRSTNTTSEPNKYIAINTESMTQFLWTIEPFAQLSIWKMLLLSILGKEENLGDTRTNSLWISIVTI